MFFGICFFLFDNFESRGQLTNFVQHFSNLSRSKFLRENFQRSECTQGMTWRVTANEQLAAFLPIFYLFVSLVSLIVSPAPPCTALCHMSYSAPWRCLNPSNTISLRRKDFCTLWVQPIFMDLKSLHLYILKEEDFCTVVAKLANLWNFWGGTWKMDTLWSKSKLDTNHVNICQIGTIDKQNMWICWGTCKLTLLYQTDTLRVHLVTRWPIQSI